MEVSDTAELRRARLLEDRADTRDPRAADRHGEDEPGAPALCGSLAVQAPDDARLDRRGQRSHGRRLEVVLRSDVLLLGSGRLCRRPGHVGESETPEGPVRGGRKAGGEDAGRSRAGAWM